eukprot:CAMPEP_0195298076 /NCGR_PEP_ID=MMETSP0707-20130614/22725_1 /TAXON_ID=33640 /ORGANISM="Asterionellopsis glacialis, Strain CCMP134" /LENGTH=425 /DNA_ID=CAMNT_0040360067 /DNA_START=123 /DNA_END=1400 /DNA_ORIENTATION=-
MTPKTQTSFSDYSPLSLFGKRSRMMSSSSDNTGNSDNDDSQESSSSSTPPSMVNMKELLRRIQSLKDADAMEQEIQNAVNLNSATNHTDSSGRSSTVLLDLPVVAFDSLLPNQRLSGTTTDPTFSRFLRDLGLGGMFVMTSVDPYKRLIRRNGVVARIEIVDAGKGGQDTPDSSRPSLSSIPTAVDFVIVGRYHCHIVGPPAQMKRRIGRWRRAYDPDGEETRLGWGVERFLSLDSNNHTTTFVSLLDDQTDLGQETAPGNNIDGVKLEEWSWSTAKVMIVSNNNMKKNNKNNNHSEDTPFVADRVKEILELLDTWEQLASNEQTYDNVDVVASTRILKGHPGLTVDPKRLLHKVRQELGDLPTTSAEDLVLWIAAYMNPLPSLGVAPEIRGRVLEASPNLERQLKIVKLALQKSIRNLQGKEPL